jgi:hypothetical protein
MVNCMTKLHMSKIDILFIMGARTLHMVVAKILAPFDQQINLQK